MAKSDEVLTLGFQLEIDKAIKGMSSFERQMKAKMKAIEKSVVKMGGQSKAVYGSAIDLSGEWLDETGKLGKGHAKESKLLRGLASQIEDLEEAYEGLHETQKAGAREQINRLKKMGDGAAHSARKVGKSSSAKSSPKASTKGLGESWAKGFVEAAQPAVSAFFSKDLKGTLEGTMTFAGKALSKGLDNARKRAAISDAKAAKTKEKQAVEAASKGLGRRGKLADIGGGKLAALPGSSAGAAGAAAKASGDGMGKMSSVLSMVSKLGPVISTISTVIMAVVKLLIDAEAQAKGFNKEILASASTTEYLAQAGGNADLAFSGIQSTLRGIRDSAHDIDNLAWGISADEHKAVINTLTQEGVSLLSIEKQAQAAKMEVGAFAKELVHTGVAYSRAFGVPLQEINQLQAEMMTEMGMSLESTQLGFAQMTLAAADSGIAANKFYATIRSISQDLSLYNIRMEQSVKMLKLLGKVMNPRDAQKFMQFATQGLKNMSQGDRLKLTVLAGDEGKKIFEKDMANRRKNLTNDIAKALGKKDPKDIAKIEKSVAEGGAKGWIDQVGDETSRVALRGSSIELKIDETASKKGLHGQAFAMQNMGMGASLDMMTAALAKWGGGKTLMDGAGSIGMTKMAENIGVSTDQLRAMMHLEVAVQEQKDMLLAQGEAALAAAQTEDQRRAAMEQISLAQTGGTQAIIDTMSEEEQALLKDANKSQLDVAKQQGQLTSSMLDKLSVLVDFVMNQLYNLFFDLWDSFGELSILLSPTKIVEKGEERNIKRYALLSRDKGMQQAVQKASVGPNGFDKYAFRGHMVGGPGNLEASIADAFRHYEEARANSGKDEGAMVDASIATLTTMLGNSLKPDQLAAAIKDATGSEEKAKAAEAALTAGGTATEAMKAAGLSTDEMVGTYKKSAWYIDPASLAAGGSEIKQAASLTGNARVLGSEADVGQMKLFERNGLGAQAKAAGFGPSGFLATAEGQALQSGANTTAGGSAEAADTTAESTAATAEVVSQEGATYFRSAKTFQKNFAKNAEEGVLASVRQALWEFYLYSEEEDRSVLLTKMAQSGDSLEAMTKGVGLGGVGAYTGKTPTKTADAPKNQTGGVVTGIGSDGLANVRAAAGEGLTSIGRGEVIVPRGGTIGRSGDGGSTRVEISVQRGFEQFIDAKVIEGIQNFKRREPFQ